MKKVLVRVILNTYNNEKTIQKCLDSILAQKTDFDFEILVYDDASTDKTAEIIKLYEKKYPEIIKPIYQTENQAQKGIDINKEYQYGRAQGKYIAIADADGYWISEEKLQLQLDSLEHHPEISMCAHSSVLLLDKDNRKTKKLVVSKKNCVLTFERIISIEDSFVPVNSIMYRANVDETHRAFREKYPFIYTGVLQCGINGGVLYLGKIMSVCRKKSFESEYDEEKAIKGYELLCDMLTEVDKETNSEFAELINLHKIQQRFNILKIQKNYREMKSKEYKIVFKKLSLKEKIKVRFSK